MKIVVTASCSLIGLIIQSLFVASKIYLYGTIGYTDHCIILMLTKERPNRFSVHRVILRHVCHDTTARVGRRNNNVH